MLKIKRKKDMSIRGVLSLRILRNGVEIEQYTKPNLIVNSGLTVVQQRLSVAATDKHITKITVGELTGGDFVEPDPEWTDVPDPILTKAIASATYPTARSVSFNFEINGSEANGTDISYFGLKSEDGTLFAAKSRAPISKTADITITGTWIINF